jgi:hypothetical protein
MLEASRFDTLVAYAAVNRFRVDDIAPHVWRTRDGGRTWAETVNGLPPDVVVNAVREDPVARNLLYAATERGVFVSFDAADHWQSLRQNLPATSVRDLVVHGADLVIGTHGRSFWILDDVTPLRQAAALAGAKDAALCRPARATRVRWNRNTDTPLPPDEPAGQNPPDGAILDYRLARDASGPVTLEVLDGGGRLVRRFSSDEVPPAPETYGNVPGYWMRREGRLGADAGTHRFVWDLHETPPPAPRQQFSIAAIAGQTPAEPLGPWVVPGTYTVRLTVDGNRHEQPLEVRMDPRVRITSAELAGQHALSLRLVAAWRADSSALARARALRAGLQAATAGAERDSLRRDIEALEGQGGGWWSRVPGAPPSLASLAGEIARAYDLVQECDAPPTAVVAASPARLERALDGLLARERALEERFARVPGATVRSSR